MNGVQTRLKCKPNVKRCKRFVFAAHSPLLHPNTLKTKAIIHFQTDHILTRFVFPPLNVETNTFDTSFLKLREMRLEYKLPNSTLKKTPFSKASVALYARNLFCITDYPLFDPESAALNGSSMVTGVETGSLPTARTFGLNINVSF